MISAYDAIADWYDEVVREGALIHDLVLPQMLDWMNDLAGQHVCDVACGQGWLARELARRGAQVTGVDLSGELLAKARSYEAHEPLGITYLHDDAQQLGSLADTSFDGATCNMALTDIPDLHATLRSIARILRPGGWFMFAITHPCYQTPDSDWISGADGTFRREVGGYFVEGFWRSDNPNGVRGKVGAHHRTLSSYLNSLRAAGLRLEQIAEPQANGALAERLPGYAVVPAVLLVYCRA